jgi:copper homeostasis protein
MIIEVCVQGIESVAAAAAGRAHRIELCEALGIGGVTPSHGMIAIATKEFSGPIHVLIRPRAGDFVVSDRELRVMLKDIERAKALGIAGIATGALLSGGKVDRPKLAALLKVAQPLEVTFHRAFDLIEDQESALTELIELGVKRILTAGGARSAREGLDRLSKLQKSAGDRLTILAGGACVEQDLAAFAASGLDEAHFGSATHKDGKSDADKIRSLIEAAEGLTYVR